MPHISGKTEYAIATFGINDGQQKASKSPSWLLNTFLTILIWEAINTFFVVKDYSVRKQNGAASLYGSISRIVGLFQTKIIHVIAHLFTVILVPI